MVNLAPADPNARRRQSWTKRLDENGRKGKLGYFTGTEWLELEAAAMDAGFFVEKKLKGVPTKVPDVTAYVMHLVGQNRGVNQP